MGLDVHDVGLWTQPIEKGMVFTCEPGIYIREEGIGIRIEDGRYPAGRLAAGARCFECDPRDHKVRHFACFNQRGREPLDRA